MQTYHNHTAEPYFTFLKLGQKDIEGRLQIGWYRDVKIGDHIIVYDEEETDSIESEVLGVRKYVSIKHMLETEQIKRLLPDIDTVDEGVKVYRGFYDKEQEEKFGAVAIEVRLIT